MNDGLTPLLRAAIGFAYVGGLSFTALGVYLSVRGRRLHPLLLVCISAISISWIESPYDWAMYAQFPTAIPRMPSWWPMNKTWGGLPSSAPPGYIAYFVLPAFISVAVGKRLSASRCWRRPQTLLAMGLQMSVFTYLLGRTDSDGRTIIDAWADSKTKTRLQSALLSVAAVVLLGHALYGAVFAPHLVTKLRGAVTAGPTEQLFDGVPNQPLHGD